MDWLISVGDALSQLLGRLIWIRHQGRWRTWTDSPNESISGAADRWAEMGYYEWVAPSIDWLSYLWLDGRGHCRRARDADLSRAINLVIAEGMTVGGRHE